MTLEQQLAALRRWPRVLALAFIRYHDKPAVTWQEFCEAQDDYEEAMRFLVYDRSEKM